MSQLFSTSPIVVVLVGKESWILDCTLTDKGGAQLTGGAIELYHKALLSIQLGVFSAS